jgi:LemA protein
MLGIILIVLAIVIVLFIVLPASWIIGGYNTLAGNMQNIKTMFSNVKTEYQRRADLFYNLVEATKSHAKFEKDTLTEVIAMRNGNFGKTPKEAMSKMKGFNGLMSKLMLVVERYPKLRSTEQYQILMKETRITEDRINIARTEYNDTVRDYNLFVVSFPSNIIAGMFHFAEEPYFENEEGTNKAPKMDLKI